MAFSVIRSWFYHWLSGGGPYPTRISTIAYALGVLINFYRFDGYGIAREVPMPWLHYFHIMFDNVAAAAAIGAAMALIGQLGGHAAASALRVGGNQ